MANNSKKRLTDYILEKSKKKDKNLKYDFMPSLLEIIERPAHVSSKVIIIAISCLLFIAVLWACLAKIDIVVSGQGTITTDTKPCIVMSETSGIVKKVYAYEGDYVSCGDILLELDASEYYLEMERLRNELETLKVQQDVINLYMNDTKESIDITEYDEKYRYALQELIYENELYRIQKEQSIYVSETVDIQYLASLNERMVAIESSISAYEYELDRQQLLLDKMTIKAKATGYIMSMSATYEGQAISAMGELCVIIPDDSKYVFEGYVSDKDIADVAIGTTAELKVQSYPYSDYGSIDGTIEYISPSAVIKEGIGNVYIVRVAIDERSMREDIKLISGLTGVMEIHIGRRSVMDYFLEPIVKGLEGSLKEK